ncbi:major facilitator superfamily domain-containing protein [Aspergillus flavus]|nr:major facilitator superfamily domain-containing protein [Aspergillus flavus]
MDGTKDSGTDHVEQYVENPKDQDLRSVPTALLDWSPEERRQREKALVRKIDTRLLIIMLVMYILNYLDRNNIAAAKLAGLQDDLNLKGEEYQVCVSILIVGYLLMQVPSNMILNRFGKPSIYLPGCMVVWGIISCLTAVTKDFGGLLAVRFFLGIVEAAYSPGCLYFLSAWYTRKELVERTALLYVGSLISGAFSGLISAGITSGLNGARGIAAWRWLFIIEGSLTVYIAIISAEPILVLILSDFVALLACFIVPDLPRTTSWLSNDEKVLAAWRLEEDIGEDDWVDSEHQSMFHGAKLAIL